MSSSDVLASPAGVDLSSSPKSPLAKTQHPDKDSKPVTKQNPVPASPLLHGLKLAPHRELEQAQQRGRLKCSSCGGSRMFFCYTCCSLVGVSQQEIPSVKLPIKIDIIKHPSEVDGKSTAIHAKILAPDDVTIYTYPCIPDYEDDTDKVVLVFPGPGSVSVEEMTWRLQNLADMKSAASPDKEPSPKRPRAEEKPGATQQPEGQTSGATHTEERGGEAGIEGQTETPRACPLQRVVFIDSTWNQTTRIITDETTGVAPCGAEDQEDVFLAPSEGFSRHLPGNHRGCLLLPQGLPGAVSETGVHRTVRQPDVLLLLPTHTDQQG
uniref:tRNA-uridine aminocarboxypropyltransferase 1 n=1 Tax=Hucho hucho TaxID=62062 RepID=A0A4W5MNC4_9TELE